MTYKVGTHINFNKQAKRQRFLEEAQLTGFWVIAFGLFFWCIFS